MAEKSWTDDLEFIRFKETYPKRMGGENWKQVYKAWQKAMKDHMAKVMIDGAKRYREYCEATDRIGTGYVQMATTFIHQENWLKPWDTPERKFIKHPAKTVHTEKPLPPSASELLKRRNDPRGSK